jgi:hypothetical protein
MTSLEVVSSFRRPRQCVDLRNVVFENVTKFDVVSVVKAVADDDNFVEVVLSWILIDKFCRRFQSRCVGVLCRTFFKPLRKVGLLERFANFFPCL